MSEEDAEAELGAAENSKLGIAISVGAGIGGKILSPCNE